MRAAWQASAEADALTYRLYRSDAAPITTVAGLNPVITGITQPVAIDSRPSLAEHSYAVTAVDAAGNESGPSNSAYLNAALLPVATLEVVPRPASAPSSPGPIRVGVAGSGVSRRSAASAQPGASDRAHLHRRGLQR
ncbi:MAG: hypothetical protein U5J82_15905 [Desulfobacterales bacterium]|nr:hypothetical protein [Desulfobacterales bacterium]